MANVPITPDSLKRISHQPRVRDFLSAAVVEGRLSHAYLFLGAPGSGMLEAADALAQCVVCPNGGDGSCDECIRVSHHTHPDVHHLAPAGVAGYLVDQVRELVEDVAMAPIRASSKVYILDGIVSRCQQVPFRVVPTEVALESVGRKAGVGANEARIALAVAGTPERAAEFLASPGRRNARRCMVRTLGELEHDDAWDVLVSARELCEVIRQPLEEVKARQDRTSSEDEEFLSAKALRQIEEMHKRELTARERSGIMEALAAAESLLRDVLVSCEGTMEPIVNTDVADVVQRISASASTRGALSALDACHRAARDIAQNVTPQLALEVMLLSIKEALACPPLYR